MKRDSYETPRISCFEVSVERGFAQSGENWYESEKGNGQPDWDYAPEEETWG